MSKTLEELFKESRLVKPRSVTKSKSNVLGEWEKELNEAAKKRVSELEECKNKYGIL